MWHDGILRRVIRGHVWFQAVAASPLRVPDEGIVVEERRPVIQAVLGDGMDRQLTQDGKPVGSS
jgi:hypothetical protein